MGAREGVINSPGRMDRKRPFQADRDGCIIIGNSQWLRYSAHWELLLRAPAWISRAVIFKTCFQRTQSANLMCLDSTTKGLATDEPHNQMCL